MNFSIKYRPQSLDQVVGHSKIIKELKKRTKENDFPYVMIFTGKTGTGKTTLQRILAKNILCKSKDENGNSCNKCEICKTVDEEKISNYYYEYNASNIGIDEMRNIEELAMMRSLNTANGKVIVIDELQELSSNKKAAKNILKLLEKPIKNTFFILGAMNEDKVEKSILNRSVKYRLKDVLVEDISNYLMSVCVQENIDLKDKIKLDAIINISQNSDGSVRAAISYLERVIYSDLWDSKDLLTDLGIVSQETITRWINGLFNQDASILSNEITVEFLEKVNRTLLIYLKALYRLDIPTWQKNQYLSGLGKFDANQVLRALQGLNEYLKYVYTNNYLLEYNVLNVFNEIKLDIEENKHQEKVMNRLWNDTTPIKKEEIPELLSQPKRRRA